MKKIITFLIFVISIFAFNLKPKQVVEAENITSVKVVSNYAYIYESHDVTSSIIHTCAYGTLLSIKQNSILSYTQFYEISIYNIVDGATEEEIGYVLKSQVLDISINSPKKTLQNNASIKNDNSIVYTRVINSTNVTYTETSISLSKDTKIQILDGYDKNKEYTQVAFYQDEQIVTYFIKTSDIYVFGVNYSVIVGVMTLITVACTISIVLGVKNRKKKKLIK